MGVFATGRQHVYVGVITITACINPHQTVFVGKGSDHLQLIKFWPSHAPGKGVCGGAKIFGSALLQTVRSVFVSLSTFFHFKSFYCRHSEVIFNVTEWVKLC